MYFWDWKSGYNFQRLRSQVQPGSIDSEAGIYALAFDRSGSRLVSCEADKTIKIFKEDETSVSLPISIVIHLIFMDTNQNYWLIFVVMACSLSFNYLRILVIKLRLISALI